MTNGDLHSWNARISAAKRRQPFERGVDKASAQDFLNGTAAADLTFGIVILGLGFFMLMWVIATG